MIRAVIYARYSSTNQREESIAGQIRDCKRYAKQNDFDIIEIYTDSALTGRSDKRPGFQKMIKDSETHTFQAVIVWKLDRFARDRYDSAMYRHKLKQNGVRIYSAMENISESPEGIILEGMMEALAEYYSANLAENVKRGLYDSALDRKILGSPTFGYRRGSDGKYEIDPATAPIVKRVFLEYASGKPYMDIIKDLNAEGIRTVKGRPFVVNSLRKILRNEKYIGMYRYRDIEDPNGIPPIIDVELFERVQREIKKRSFTKKRSVPGSVPESDYILTSKLFCGHCKEAMIGESARSATGETYRYYTCVGSKRKRNGCTKKRVPKQAIETEVLRILNETKLTDEYIEYVADQAMIYQAEHRKNEIQDVHEAELKDCENRIRNITAAIETGSASVTLAARLEELEKQRDLLISAIERDKLRNPIRSRESIIEFLQSVRAMSKRDSRAQIKLLDMFVKKIYLFDDPDDPKAQRLVLELKYDDSEETVPYDEIVRLIYAHPCHFVNKRTIYSSILIFVKIKA